MRQNINIPFVYPQNKKITYIIFYSTMDRAVKDFLINLCKKKQAKLDNRI